MNPLIQSKNTTILPVLIALTLVCFGLLPHARAVCLEGCTPLLNTFLGDNALVSITTGSNNTATGYQALKSDNTGSNNTAVGSIALVNNTTGSQNTAIGDGALVGNTIGFNNTAIGYQALFFNTGSENTATGYQALWSNTTGFGNTATGFGALDSNTIGNDNTATGFGALDSNTTGNNNTATGFDALGANTTAFDNTANGWDALFSNTTGASNTAMGSAALFSDTSGGFNTALGARAMVANSTGGFNTAVGFVALANNTTGSNNIAVGNLAGLNLTSGSNNIDIANEGGTGESKTIRIGTTGTQTKTFIAGISGATVANGVGVIVATTGKLGTINSSARFKDAIKPMDKASEAILALKPVTFRYKHELDPEGIPQFGLVAEEVDKVNPDLVARDDQGKPYTVRYEAVNAMLLNEFLKEHRTVQQQQKEIDALKAELKTQRAFIQAVNDKVELSQSTPQTVLNNQ